MTTLYLIRHGATAANLERPYRLQGQRSDPDLAPVGVRQAELTRDVLAMRPFTRIVSSPLRRAMQTAEIIAAPRRLRIETASALTECDVGLWEGLSWEGVRCKYPEALARFQLDPGAHPYLGGESFEQVAARVVPCFERLLAEHAGEDLLVVSHHIVNRIYLAGLLGLPPSKAKLVKLDNCGISVVSFDGHASQIVTLNAGFHLSGVGVAA